jgi:hypothetical protein
LLIGETIRVCVKLKISRESMVARFSASMRTL